MKDLFKTDVVSKHQGISNDAFSLFNETLNKLSKAEDLVKADIELAEAEIQSAIDKKNALISIRNKNNNLSENINKFFNTL